MAIRALPPYDPARDFIVDREGWLCGGRRYRRGEAFRKLGLTPRQIRLFYDQRVIRFADPAEHEKRGPTPVPIGSKDAKRRLAPQPKTPDAEQAATAVDALIDAHTLANLKATAATLGIDISHLRTKRDIAGAIVDSGNEPS
jgi:hypothetical protein